MGIYNSSKYRVRPLMERVEKDYEAFLSLLALVEIEPLGKPILYRYDGEAGTDCKEMALKPTKKQLKKLLKLVFYISGFLKLVK